jgi:hypothetical protein
MLLPAFPELVPFIAPGFPTYTPVGGSYGDTTGGLDRSLDQYCAFHYLLLSSGPTVYHP